MADFSGQNFTALMAALEAEFDQIDTDLAAIIAIEIDTATGEQLDLLGGMIGQKRTEGLEDDAEFRRLLKAWRPILRGDSSTNGIIELLSNLYGSVVTVAQNGVACFLFYHAPSQQSSQVVVDATELLLSRCVIAGVCWDGYEFPDAPGEPCFLFDADGHGINEGFLNGIQVA